MPFLLAESTDTLVRLKVVPGSSRDAIAGVLGDRLKVKVAAAPEAGRANEAVCELLARAIGIRARQVTIESGPTSAEKVARARGIGPEAVRAALGKYL